MAEKANLMEKAALLLEMKEVQKALLEDSLGGWRRTLQAIGSLARMECDENVKKLSMSTRSFRSSAFNLWKSALNLQLNTPSQNKVWPLVDASVWLDTIGLLSSVFNMYSTSDIPFSSLIPIWKTCVSRLKKSISDDKRSERLKLSELFEILTRSMRCTELHLRIENVIEEFKGLIDNYSWPGKDPAKTNFLEVLNNLCGSYGFEQRDLLLTSFFPIAEKLWELRELALSRTLFMKFLEHVLVMSIPDCELNSFNYEPVFPVAQKCLSQIVEEFAEQITKSASVFRPTAKCIIPAAKVPLIARMFIITHLKYKHSSNRDGSTEDRPRPRKRAKKIIFAAV
uniref:Uncharacterized protein n=1 Tax=Ditylenchus dipsaci TaxID=166011 RepID=A0A915E8T2_9BILA